MWKTIYERQQEIKEKQNKFSSVHALNNGYGYFININHPLINPKWENWVRMWADGEIENDKLYSLTERRLEFERRIMASGFYKKIVQQEIQRVGAEHYAFMRSKFEIHILDETNEQTEQTA